MSQPASALTQLFPTSLRAWQARWKATQGLPAAEPLTAQTPAAVRAPAAEPTTKAKRRRKRSGRMALGPVASQA